MPHVYELIKCSALCLYPLITRPTQITGTTATIIDNIFCSEQCKNKVCGIGLSDATYHMPIFIQTVKYKRKLYEDSLNKLEHDLNDVNWKL